MAETHTTKWQRLNRKAKFALLTVASVVVLLIGSAIAWTILTGNFDGELSYGDAKGKLTTKAGK